MSYILDKKWVDGLLFISKAIEKENEEVIFQMYLHENFVESITFDEYKEKVIKKPFIQMNDTDLEDLVKSTEKIIERRGDVNGDI